MLLYRRSKITLIVGVIVFIATVMAYLFIPTERLGEDNVAFFFILIAEIYFFAGIAKIENTQKKQSSLFRVVSFTLLTFYLIAAVVLNTTIPSLFDKSSLALILTNIGLLAVVSLCLYVFVHMRKRVREQYRLTKVVTERLNELIHRVDLLREAYHREEYFVQLAELKAAISNCDFTKDSDVDAIIDTKINELSKSFALNKEHSVIDGEIDEIMQLIKQRG
jgi:hypothetical protein